MSSPWLNFGLSRQTSFLRSKANDCFRCSALGHQVEQLRAGVAPDDFIDPKTLNPLARSYLREAFRAVASVQSGLANELAMGIRWS